MLKPDDTSKVEFNDGYILTIKKKIIPENAVSKADIAVWCKKGWKMKPCRPFTNNGKAKAIIIHNTTPIKVKGTTMSEQYTRATYPNCKMGGVVVHFYVSPEEAWQNLNENEQGWHAKDGSATHKGHENATYDRFGGNTDGIAIEIIGEESEENGARLAAYLMKVHDLKIEDIYTHNYCMHGTDKIKAGASKNCPLYILDHWQSFLDKVSKYRKMLDEPGKTTINVLHRVQVGAFSTKANAEKYKNQLISDGFTNAYVTSTRYNGKTLYRVQVGAFYNSKNAASCAVKLKSAGYDVFIVYERTL